MVKDNPFGGNERKYIAQGNRNSGFRDAATDPIPPSSWGEGMYHLPWSSVTRGPTEKNGFMVTSQGTLGT